MAFYARSVWKISGRTPDAEPAARGFRRLVLPGDAMGLIVFFALLTTATVSSAGSIAGKVTWRGTATDFSNAIVYAERNPKGSPAAPKTGAVMDQLSLKFVPHVLPVLVGTKVLFPNSDEVRHNVFSPSAPKRFNLGTYPRGLSREVIFDKPGEVALLCNVHSEMSAYVLVLETPHFTVSDKDGSYSLKDLPPGSYTVTVWHERFKSTSASVDVKESETVPLNLTLTTPR